jgi:hypothetical protein
MKSIALAIKKTAGDLRGKRDDTPYPMTPDQYYDQRARSRHLEGESRLLFAVLEDAIRCYTLAARTGRRSHQRALEEVRKWVNTEGDHDLFSFDSICRVFDIEPARLRHQLNALGAGNIRLRRFRTVGRRITIAVTD